MTTREKIVPTAALYRKAAEIIETYGWTKGLYHNKETNCYCTAGAIARAFLELEEGEIRDDRTLLDNFYLLIGDMMKEGDEDVLNILLKPVAYHLANTYEPTAPNGYVYNWNDAPDRDKEDVIEMLNELADKMEATNADE